MEWALTMDVFELTMIQPLSSVFVSVFIIIIFIKNILTFMLHRISFGSHCTFTKRTNTRSRTSLMSSRAHQTEKLPALPMLVIRQHLNVVLLF